MSHVLHVLRCLKGGGCAGEIYTVVLAESGWLRVVRHNNVSKRANFQGCGTYGIMFLSALKVYVPVFGRLLTSHTRTACYLWQYALVARLLNKNKRKIIRVVIYVTVRKI